MWTLFIADLGAGGGTDTLNYVALSIMTVPEPQSSAIMGGGVALFVLLRWPAWLAKLSQCKLLGGLGFGL